MLPRLSVMPAPAQQGAERRVPHHAHHQGTQDADLRLQMRPAGVPLGLPRNAVVRRPALYRVGDVDVIPGDTGGPQRLGEYAARLSHEGPAPQVLAASGGLAHEHDPRTPRTQAGHGICPRLAQRASRAGADGLCGILQGHAPGAHTFLYEPEWPGRPGQVPVAPRLPHTCHRWNGVKELVLKACVVPAFAAQGCKVSGALQEEGCVSGVLFHASDCQASYLGWGVESF